MSAFEARYTPADIAFVETPEHRRPARPSDVPKSRVNAVRRRMESGEIDASYEVLRDGRKRWWTTASRYAASVNRSGFDGKEKRERPSEMLSEGAGMRLLSPEEMAAKHAAAKVETRRPRAAATASRPIS